jgi:alpha-beta hydrolase superfamily lysophospholipase
VSSVALFGLSMGGYLAYMTAAKGRQVAGVIATTLCDPRLPIVRDQFARSPTLNRLLLPLMPLAVAVCGGLRLPLRWFGNMEGIANDPDLMRLICSDPVGAGSHVSVRFMSSIFSVRPAIEPEDFDLCPLLLAHPAADRWTSVDASRPFFDRIRGPKEMVMLDNCGHLPIEQPGWSQLQAATVRFLARLQPSKSA